MGLENISLFVHSAFRDFLSLGEITPSSHFSAKGVVKHGRISTAKRILEIGPGMGPFTKEILRVSPATAEIVVIDKNPDFIEFLKKDIPDTRLVVICGDIITIPSEELGVFDSIISSIPLSLLECTQKVSFSQKIHRLLKPGGVFTKAQYSLSSTKYFKESGFGPIKWNLEIRNIPPIFIYSCQKNL
ncbi:MAG: methyltransferase domain-containing protein [Candidatus Pacebacteria bacterium]|jgi:phospholipid N-methyltransferase|nr:methyltransferase domain-containing protein [Candidatus Paceibacterota bacterium]